MSAWAEFFARSSVIPLLTFLLKNELKPETGWVIWTRVREDTHKKKCFFSGRTTKDLTPPPKGLVVHATFFFFLSYNSLKRILTKRKF